MVEFVAADTQEFFECLCLLEGGGWAKGDHGAAAVLYAMVVWVRKELKDKLVFRLGEGSKIFHHPSGECLKLMDKGSAVKMDLPMKPGMELGGFDRVGFTV